MSGRTNGGCNCSDCHAAPPVTPVEHALRLEVTDEWTES